MLVEPEMRLLVSLTESIVLNLGAGYRATSSLHDLLGGPTAMVGLQFVFN
jgi:hypothetical protein